MDKKRCKEWGTGSSDRQDAVSCRHRRPAARAGTSLTLSLTGHLHPFSDGRRRLAHALVGELLERLEEPAATQWRICTRHFDVDVG